MNLLSTEAAVTRVSLSSVRGQVEFSEPPVAIVELKTCIIILLPPAGHCSGVTSQDMYRISARGSATKSRLICWPRNVRVNYKALPYWVSGHTR
jgi:hypothetical protein